MSDHRPELDPYLSLVFKPLNPSRDEVDERVVFYEMGRAAGASEVGSLKSAARGSTVRVPNRESHSSRLQWLAAATVIAVCSFVAGRMGSFPDSMISSSPSQNSVAVGNINGPSANLHDKPEAARDAIHPVPQATAGEAVLADAPNPASLPRELSSLGLWFPARLRMPGQISVIASGGRFVVGFSSARSGNTQHDREPLRPADVLRFDGQWFGDTSAGDPSEALSPLNITG